MSFLAEEKKTSFFCVEKRRGGGGEKVPYSALIPNKRKGEEGGKEAFCAFRKNQGGKEKKGGEKGPIGMCCRGNREGGKEKKKVALGSPPILAGGKRRGGRPFERTWYGLTLSGQREAKSFSCIKVECSWKGGKKGGRGVGGLFIISEYPVSFRKGST